MQRVFEEKKLANLDIKNVFPVKTWYEKEKIKQLEINLSPPAFYINTDLDV